MASGCDVAECGGGLRREVELVGMLRETRAVLAPSADASARMRARVMAGAAMMMAQPSKARALAPEPDTSGESISPRRGQAHVLPLRDWRPKRPKKVSA